MPKEYGYVKAILPEVKEMAEQGKSQREIAEHFGLKDKYVIKELLKRERRKERIIPKSRGRKHAVDFLFQIGNFEKLKCQ